MKIKKRQLHKFSLSRSPKGQITPIQLLYITVEFPQQNTDSSDEIDWVIAALVLRCVELVNHNVNFENQVYSPKTISGILSGPEVKFYTSESSDFIYYDSYYDSWRIG